MLSTHVRVHDKSKNYRTLGNLSSLGIDELQIILLILAYSLLYYARRLFCSSINSN